jgi:hypothetical protein
MSKILSVNKRCYPAKDVIYGCVLDAITTTTVLVEGEIDDYAAYTGHGDPEWVADRGDKISFAEACCHFGGLDKEKYRD